MNLSEWNGTSHQESQSKSLASLSLYGAMALFWFLYVVVLYRVCRCFFKERTLKQEATDLQQIEGRLKKETAISNGQCVAIRELPTAKPPCTETKNEPDIGTAKSENFAQSPEIQQVGIKVPNKISETCVDLVHTKEKDTKDP